MSAPEPGRFALPIARALDPSGGSVLALDTSPSMLEGLREVAEDYAIENVRTVEARWPPADPSALEADVVLIAHVGYDVEAIGAFVDALEAAASRLCVAVLTAHPPASAADPFWPPVHGEPRSSLPALPDFVELLRSRGRAPSVERIAGEPRRFESMDALEGFLRRQLWIDPAGQEGDATSGGTRRSCRRRWGRLDDSRPTPDRHRGGDLEPALIAAMTIDM